MKDELKSAIDRGRYLNDPTYHYSIDLFSRFLDQLERVMQREGFGPLEWRVINDSLIEGLARGEAFERQAIEAHETLPNSMKPQDVMQELHDLGYRPETE